ncbi:MAG: hypothetical protein Cons2KO_27990 [Congregibacter sp.]
MAQFATNRAVQRAIETNTRAALERVRLTLKVKDSAGKVVLQQTSRNGRYLLLIFEDQRPRVWDLERSRYWDHFESAESPIRAAAIGGDMQFVTVHADGHVARWSAESATPVSQVPTALTNAVSAELGRTGELLIAADDGQIYAFADVLRRLGQASSQISGSRAAMSMDPSGDVFATAVSSSSLRLWSSRTGTAVADIDVGREISAYAFGDLSSQLFVATDGAVIDWDSRASRAIGEFACPSACDIRELLVNSATQSLLAVTRDGELLRWSLRDRQIVEAAVAPEAEFTAVSTATGAPLLIGGTSSGFVQFTHLQRSESPLTLVSTRSGWAMIDPLGRFDGQAGADIGVSWASEDAEFPLPSFVDTHFEPGLFGKWLGANAGYLTEPTALSDGVLVPPRIEMTLQALEPTGSKQQIEVRVKVADNGGGLGAPSLYHLGLRVSADKQVDQETAVENNRAVSVTTWRVSALQGENTFTARVKDADGVLSPARVDSLQVNTGASDPAMHILAIAIDEYGDPRLNLNYSIADADAVVTQLAALAEPLYSTVHKTVIRNEQATRTGVLEAVRELRTANPEDVIVIYAATHGEVIDEKFHLLLQGLRFPLNKRVIRRSAIAFDDFAEELEGLDARRVVLLLDTCKSGDALADLQNEFRDRRALQSFGNLLGVHLIAATAKGQLATESSVLGHGVFTYSLLEALSGKADSKPADGLLTASELAGFAEAGVPALSAQYAAFPQWPTVYTRGFDFDVARPTASATAKP